MNTIDAIYKCFFSVLNQLILIGMSLAMMGFGGYRSIGLPFALLFLSVNGWAIFLWRSNGPKKAWEFYSAANIGCFMALALLGLLSSALLSAEGAKIHSIN